MGPLDLVHLTPLMARTMGRAEIKIGLIDGPVTVDHPDLAGQNIHRIAGRETGICSVPSSVACLHGTFVAGMLSAKRGSIAAAICPGCTVMGRSICAVTGSTNGGRPSAMPEELASAIIDTVNAGARLINLSAAVIRPSARGERELEEALSYAGKRNVIVVVAAGNQGTVGSSVISRHPWSIPVAACNLQGRLMAESNLGSSIGKYGLLSPGDEITSLGTNGKPQASGGTSAAGPFFTGAAALLWSGFPGASATQIRLALMHAGGLRRRTIAPPLLDAWAAYAAMESGRPQ